MNLFTPQTAHHPPINKDSHRGLREDHKGEDTTGKGAALWRAVMEGTAQRPFHSTGGGTSGSCRNSERQGSLQLGGQKGTGDCLEVNDIWMFGKDGKDFAGSRL